MLHDRCKIGDNVNVGTNVTIGGRSGHYEVPVIGNNVYKPAGAKILGPVKVGNNVTIWANAVVINDVKDNRSWKVNALIYKNIYTNLINE